MKLKDNNVDFRLLSFSDIPLMCKWFNMPHVQKFYSLHSWSEHEVFEKLKPYITSEKPVIGFIVLMNQQPIGYVQYYKIADYPWPQQGLSQDIIDNAAGMDVLIGEESMIGRGIGQLIISQFLHTHVFPKFNYCLVDPSTKNQAAIGCYQKLGFKKHKILEIQDSMGRVEQVQLMIMNYDMRIADDKIV